ncbi:acetate/propionate family kinase [Faecalibaculum rodentium]|uniref:acetate/propionate family kinase n=1 Tax=Faecalibaculum rodentium TaxID=1702221 RepID=UPI0025702DEB|nr:acetate kinase [Faecalibaculum rodentium]
MSIVMSVNAGSSSLKFQVFSMPEEKVLAKGLVERIGLPDSIFSITVDGKKTETVCDIPDHKVAVDMLIKALIDKGVVKNLDEIEAVGHRMVHGGEYYSDSVKASPEAEANFEKCIPLAPLHNPAGLVGYRSFREALPRASHTFVFDTAFHQTMPEKAYMYGLPYEYYDKYKVRRYGFHGTSHSFVSKRAAELAGKPYDQVKTIVCHLGNGASICAVENGRSVDTSMGLTPLEGLVMGTRSGDIDPAILEFVSKKEGLDIAGLMNMLNKKSGVFGLSNNLSSDFRDLEEGMDSGNNEAKTAFEVFCYRVAKYVGSYAAAMNGVDMIAFTAGIGENSGTVRAYVMKYLGYLGITLDEEANKKRGEEIAISTADSKVKVMVIPTNEELAIARETVALV